MEGKKNCESTLVQDKMNFRGVNVSKEEEYKLITDYIDAKVPGEEENVFNGMTQEEYEAWKNAEEKKMLSHWFVRILAWFTGVNRLQ